jgi:hypothetical protein
MKRLIHFEGISVNGGALLNCVSNRECVTVWSAFSYIK